MMQGCYLVPDSHPYEVVQAALGVRQPSSFCQLVAHHLHTKEGGLTNSLLLLLLLLLLLHHDDEGGSWAYRDPQPPKVGSRVESLDIAGGAQEMQENLNVSAGFEHLQQVCKHLQVF